VNDFLTSITAQSNEWSRLVGGSLAGVSVSSKVLAHVRLTHNNQVGPQGLRKTIISCHNTEQQRKRGKGNSLVPSHTHVHLSI